MKKIFKYFIITAICVTFAINGVHAKSYISDLFQAGDKVKIKKPIDGTAFIAGNEISVDSSIDGIGFIAGNEISINSSEEYLFVAGNQINLNNGVEKDAFIAGETIEIKNATLKRDAYIAANTIDIDGNIDRNAYLFGTDITLKGTFNGNVTISSENIKIEDGTVIKGTLKYNEDATVTGLNDSIKTKTYKVTQTPKETITDSLISFINSYIHIAILAIVLVFICEKMFKKSLDQTKDISVKKVLILCGKGLLILIGVPIIAIMLLATGWFSSVGIIGGILYGILIYVSNIFTAYALANILDKKLFKKNMNSYFLMLIGLLIIYVLGIIPAIGSFITFLSVIIGLAIAGNMIIELKK